MNVSPLLHCDSTDITFLRSLSAAVTMILRALNDIEATGVASPVSLRHDAAWRAARTTTTVPSYHLLSFDALFYFVDFQVSCADRYTE
ncbi:hypothetical protein PSPO01_15245 [Paraphaeosphaeria sporulosa]